MAKNAAVITTTTKVIPSQLVLLLAANETTGLSMFIWGPPGIGKSQLVKQQANRRGIAFIDIRLSQMDPTDLRGIPYPVVEGSVTGVRWSSPLVMPRDLFEDNVIEIEAIERIVKFYNPTGANGIRYCREPKITVKAVSAEKGVTAELIRVGSEEQSHVDEFVVALKNADGELVAGKVHYNIVGKTEGIVALEEFNSAPQSVQAAAYELILDRRLGEYRVPDGVMLTAMGNRDNDKGVTFPMPSPVANRFVHVELETDTKEWLAWAAEAMVHAEVVGFLSRFSDSLFKFDPTAASRAFPTPRSWEFVSKILWANKGADNAVLDPLIKGCVGEAVGCAFTEFRAVASKLPQPEVILSGELKEMQEPADTQLSYALTLSLVYALKEGVKTLERQYGPSFKDKPESRADFLKWLDGLDNFLAFLMNNFSAEIAILGAKTAMAVHSLPFETRSMKHFQPFAARYKGLLTAN